MWTPLSLRFFRPRTKLVCVKLTAVEFARLKFSVFKKGYFTGRDIGSWITLQDILHCSSAAEFSDLQAKENSETKVEGGAL